MQPNGGGAFGGPPAGGGGPPPEVWIILGVAVFVGIAVGITIQVFYLLTLSRCLRRCDERNRAMEPGQVWLNLIPCFNLIWLFITVNRIADSLDDEFDDRRLRADGDFGRGLGVTYNVLNLCGFIPYIGALFSIAGLVCWIIYWVKIAGYSRQLREDDEDRYNGDDPRDDDHRGYRDDDR